MHFAALSHTSGCKNAPWASTSRPCACGSARGPSSTRCTLRWAIVPSWAAAITGSGLSGWSTGGGGARGWRGRRRHGSRLGKTNKWKGMLPDLVCCAVCVGFHVLHGIRRGCTYLHVPYAHTTYVCSQVWVTLPHAHSRSDALPGWFRHGEETLSLVDAGWRTVEMALVWRARCAYRN